MRIAAAVLLLAGLAMGVTASANRQQAPKAKSGQIDINSATKEQLLTLRGIDDGLASKIIAGRPYGKAADLKASRVIPAAIYNMISARIIAAPSTAQSSGEWTGPMSACITAVASQTTR